MKQITEKVAIIGGGLAGSLMAIYLARRGFQVDVYERRPDMRRVDISAGRSINMAVSVRGIHALEQVGLRDKILGKAIPMKGRMMHDVSGELSFHPYGRSESEVIYSISRGLLNMALMDEAERHPDARFHFNHKCLWYDISSRAIHFEDELSGATRQVTSRVTIGSDGSASAIRHSMLRAGRFNLSQQYLEHGYKELTIPPGENGNFLLEKNALHIWPRGHYMLIALPNPDASFTCTLFLPFEGEEGFESLNSDAAIMRFFRARFPDAVSIMPTLLQDFRDNPTGSLVTIKCDPWFVENHVLLLGDASHAIVPFFGQGMNCAFEDCTVLEECLDQFSDWHAIFSDFQNKRKRNTDAIADMALENFIEMRDHVADEKFLLRKQVEFALEERFPDRFIPRYSMVSFHRIPYAVAQSRGAVQDEILRELCQDITDVKELNWARAAELIVSRITRLANKL